MNDYLCFLLSAMKLITILLALSFLSLTSSAQVICTQCYNQNYRVLSDTDNLIVNGGFENTTCNIFNDTHSFCPNSTYYTCDIANWTCTGGGINTYASMMDTSISSRSIIVEGTKAPYFGNYFCKSCSTIPANISCLSSLGCETTGIPSNYPHNPYFGYAGSTGVSLSQIVNGLTVGDTYGLEFWAGGETNGIAFTKPGVFAVDVGFGNIFLRNPPTARDSGIGIRYIVVFIADSVSQTIKFTNWGHIGGLNSKYTELILDDVRLINVGPNQDICTAAINEFWQNTGATVFPNPATDRITVEITSPQSAAGGASASSSPLGARGEIILFDIASRKLMQQKFTGSATLNIENLAKGIYIYEIRNEKEVVKHGKIVKE
jgi:hypothetical protein